MIKKSLCSIIIVCMLSVLLQPMAIAMEDENSKPLSAVERVKRLADLERQEQLRKGTVGTIFATVSLGVGIPLLQPSPGLTLGALLGIPLSCAGAFFLYEGLGNFFIFPNTTKIDYENIEKLSPEEREIVSAEYLKTKAIESEEKQQDELINLFGLLPRPETRERKEYRKYLEDISKK